jgi:ornithine cyclodeaminase/alanine dehydrogenase
VTGAAAGSAPAPGAVQSKVEADGILYLSKNDVSALLPPVAEQLALVEKTLTSMRAGLAELPPKPAIHPRTDAFIHAMPAYLAESDVAAVKWIGGSAGNRARGLPYLSGLIVVNNPETGAPRAILDAGDITAARTAAVSALCASRFARPGWNTASIVGFGVQGRAHARALEAINDRVEIVAADFRDASDAEIRASLSRADVLITSIRFERPAQPFVRPEWVRGSKLILPIDFDAALQPAVVEAADLFVVDHPETYAYYTSLGYFAGWPKPHIGLAEALELREPPASVVCCNLGVATLDAAFADVVIRAAQVDGVGIVLS